MNIFNKRDKENIKPAVAEERPLNKRQKWFSVLLGFLTLEIVILSLEQAKWLKEPPSLTLVLILAVLSGVLLSNLKFQGIFKSVIAVIAGLIITSWQTYLLLPESTTPWYEQLADTFRSSWNVISMSQTEESTIHFAIFLILFTWFLGIISTWLLLTKRNAWAVAIAGLLVLLLNLSNLPPKFYGFLFGYLASSLVLIGYTRLISNQNQVLKISRFAKNHGTKYFIYSVAGISILAASISWSLPDINSGLFRNIEAESTPVIKNFQEYFSNFFAQVPRKQARIKANEQQEFNFNGPYERYGDNVHFIVSSDSPQYWRTWIFDVYTSSGWNNSEITQYPLNINTDNVISDSDSSRSKITYDIEVLLKTDILLTAGEFRSADVPVQIHALDITGNDSPDIRSDTTIAAVIPYSLDTGQHYKVISSVTTATPSELASAGVNYPSWIENTYLQLPDILPDIIREASANITANVITPYEKALAISDNLSSYSYKRNTGALPEGYDAAEYFLFDKQAGACGDFASTMAVMLRTSGIPARLCIGYRIGELDPDTGKYIVRVSNRHAWTEVYFPGYGWIEFEATPGEGRTRGIVGVEAVQDDGSTIQWDPVIHMQPFELPFAVYSPSKPSFSSVDSSIVLIWPVLMLIGGVLTAAIIYFIHLYGVKKREKLHSDNIDYETEAYTGMCTLAVQAGLGPKASQTPNEYCAMLVSEFPRESSNIDIILNAFLSKRYGIAPGSDDAVPWNLVRARRNVFDAIRERIKGKD